MSHACITSCRVGGISTDISDGDSTLAVKYIFVNSDAILSGVSLIILMYIYYKYCLSHFD